MESPATAPTTARSSLNTGRLRPSLGERIAAAPAGAWLAVLVAFSAVARFAATTRIPAPWIFPDEWIYSDLARSFGESGHFRVWDVDWPIRTYGPLYPLLLSPVYALTRSGAHAYVLIRAINCVLMSSAAIPAFYLARRLLDRRRALLLAVLVLLVPSMTYTSKVMTENLAYPVFLAAVLTFARVLERPSLGRQAAALALIVVSALTRAEMAVLLPAYLCAIAMIAALDATDGGERPRAREFVARLRPYSATVLALVGALAALLVVAVAGGRSSSEVLGDHERVLGAIRLLDVPRWVLYELAEIDLAVGIVPLAAFLLVSVLVCRGPGFSRGARVFIALALPLFAAFVLLAGAYGTQPREFPHVFERYAFYVMPLLFLATIFWLQEGLPRPPKLTLGVAALAGILPVVLPYSALLNGREWGVSSSTPGLVPWAVLRPLFGFDEVLVAVICLLAGALALLFVKVAREKGGFLALSVLCNLWIITLFVATADAAVSRRAHGFQRADTSWVDDAVGPGARVGVLWSPVGQNAEREAFAILETQFFNRSVRAIYHLEEPIKSGLPSQEVERRGNALVLADGRQVRLEYVLVREGVRIRGQTVTKRPENGLVLYRVGGSVSLR